MTRVLVAGMPGTGKSTFTRWLVSHHGFGLNLSVVQDDGV
jgi:polynucleotide 5'-kinase involved in rRNA processing